MKHPALFMLCLLAGKMYAQQPVIANYQLQDGLNSMEVYKVFEDSRKFLWFATEYGVNRFDGTSFISFTTSDGLSDNIIINIYEDWKGRIWFVPLSGLPVYYFGGKLYSPQFPGGPYKNVTASVVEHNGRVCFGTHQGLLIYNEEKSVFLEIPVAFSLLGWVRLGGVDRENRLWISTGTTLYSSDDLFKNFELVDIKDVGQEFHILFNQKSFDLIRDVFKIKHNKLQIIDSATAATIQHLGRALENTPVLGCKRLKDGFWVSVLNDGIYYFPDNFHGTGSKHYLEGKNVSDVLHDFESNTWFSTLGYGIYTMRSSEVIHFTTKNGLPADKINALCADQSGKLWMGFDNALVQSYDHGLLTTLDLKKKLKCKYRVTSLLSRGKNELLIGLDDYLVRYKDGKLVALRDDNIKNYAVKCISADYERIYAGVSASLYAFDNRIEDIIGKTAIFPARVYSIFERNVHTIQVGTEKGLYEISNVNNSYTLKNITAERVAGIVNLGNNTFAYATKTKGLLITGNGADFYIDKKNGLKSDFCLKLYKEKDHILWVVTSEGLNRIEFTSLKNRKYEVSTYDINTGLSSNAVSDIVVGTDSVWVATNNGLNVLANKKNIAFPPPPLYLTSVIVNDSLQLSSDHVLSYDKNNLEIGFIAISYRNTGKVLYRYKLEGLEQNWIMSKFNIVRYAGLAPGNYNFVVEASNDGRLWSKPVRLSFQVTPAFWDTILFKVSGGFLTFALFGGIVLLRIKKIRQREEEKTRMITRTAESELKALRAQMNPHFIFNSMNAILNIIEDKDFERARNYLQRFSKLMRENLNHSSHEMISVEEEVNVLRDFFEIELLRFKDKFTYSITVDPEIDREDVCIPPMLIQPYIENAVWHGLMPKKGGGCVEVIFRKEKETLLCIIQDNGIGILEAGKRSNTLRRIYKPMGMQITRERLELLSQRYNRPAGVEIQDLSENGSGRTGTKIKITIPIYD